MSGATLYQRVQGQWRPLGLQGDYDDDGTTPTDPPITHGRLITPQNTGYTAYYDSGLGRNVTDNDMTVHNSSVTLSSITSPGGTVTRRDFKAGLVIDIPDVTFIACAVNGNFYGYVKGTTNPEIHHQFHLRYCTTYTTGLADEQGVCFQKYTAYRCNIGGSSDGAKTNGNVTITECYLRCKAKPNVQGQDPDHTDGTQNVGGNGDVTIERCNIDCRALNNQGNPNAALFAADNCTGLMTWNDNFIAGGGYVMRAYENATYNVQGNEILNNSWVFAPVARAVIPASNLTWGNVRPNYIVTSDGTRLSVVDKP